MDDLIQRLRDAIDEKYPIRGHATGELLRDAVAALAAAEARVKELEGALPRTADGVVVLPGMHIYEVDHMGHVNEYSVGGRWEKRDTSSRPLPAYVTEQLCYSTEAAAAAAARAEKEGGRNAK